jgi:hypothetical protein
LGLIHSIVEVIRAIGTFFARGLPVVAYAETSVRGVNSRLFALRASVGPFGDNDLDLDGSGGADLRVRLTPVNLLRPAEGIELTFTKRSRLQGAAVDVLIRGSGDDIRDATNGDIDLIRVALHAAEPARELPGSVQLTLTTGTANGRTNLGARTTVTAAPADLVTVAPRLLGLGAGTLVSREVLRTAQGGERIYCAGQAAPGLRRMLIADVDIARTTGAEVVGNPLFDLAIVTPEAAGPTTSPAAVAQGAPGQVGPGRYSYRTTWLLPSAPGIETPPGPASDAVTVPADQHAVRLAGLEVSPAAGARTRLYRTNGTDPHHWFRLAELPPGATTYRDQSPDAALGAALPPSPTSVTYTTEQRMPAPAPLDLRVSMRSQNMGAIPALAELDVDRLPNTWQLISLVPPAEDVAAVAFSSWPARIGEVRIRVPSMLVGGYRSALGRIVAPPPWLGISVVTEPDDRRLAQLRCATGPAGAGGLDESRPGPGAASIGGIYATLSAVAGPLTPHIPREAVAAELDDVEATASVRGLVSLRVAQGEAGVHSAETGGVRAAVRFGASGSFGGSDVAPLTRTLRLQRTTPASRVTIRADEVPDRLSIDTDLASAARLEGPILNLEAASVPLGLNSAQELRARLQISRTPPRIDVSSTRDAANDALVGVDYSASAFLLDAQLDLFRTPAVAAGMGHVRAVADVPPAVTVDVAGPRLSTAGGALTVEVAARADADAELPQSAVIDNGARVIVKPITATSEAPMVGSFGQPDAFLLRLKQVESASVGSSLGPGTLELVFGPLHDLTDNLFLTVQRRVAPSSLRLLAALVLNENVPRSIVGRAFGASSFGYRLSSAIRASSTGTRVGRFTARLEPDYRELDPASRDPAVKVAGLGSIRGDIHILPARLSVTTTALGAESIWFNESSAAGWGSWQQLGNPDDRLRTIVLAQNQNGALEAAGTAGDDTIWFNRQTSAGGAWGAWQQLGNPDDRLRTIVLAQNQNGALEAAGTAGDDTIWFNRQTSAGGAWGAWQRLGSAYDRLRWIVLAPNASGTLEGAGTAPGPITPILSSAGGRMWTMPAGWTAQRIELFGSAALALRNIEAITYGYDFEKIAHWTRIQARRIDYQARLAATPPRVDPIVVWLANEDPPGDQATLGFEIDANIPLNLNLLNSSAEIPRPGGNPAPTMPGLSSFNPVALIEMALTYGIIFLRPDESEPGQILLDTLLGSNGTRQYRIVVIRGIGGSGAAFFGNTDGGLFGREPVTFPPLP